MAANLDLMKQYKFVEFIGSGSFGRVYKMIDRATRTPRAVKSGFNDHASILTESKLLKRLKKNDAENHIVHFYELLDSSFQVFELMYANLQVWVQQQRPEGVLLTDVHVLGTRMLGAFQYLAIKRILHGDVKLDNFLMASQDPGSLKIADFGLAQRMAPDRTLTVFTEPVTIARYRAPEVILGCSTLQPQSPDLWAVGGVLLDLALNYDMPFFEPGPGISLRRHREEQVLYTTCRFLGKPPAHMLRTAKIPFLVYLLKNKKTFFDPESNAKLWAPDAEPQPLLDLLRGELAWYRGFNPTAINQLYDVIIQLLTIDPDLRATPAAALQRPFFA